MDVVPQSRFRIAYLPFCAWLPVVACMLTGCGAAPGVPSQQPGAAFQGKVNGGQQPITGAAIQLYAASGTGDETAATPLLTKTVTTGSGGLFNITGDYACPSASTLVYLVASGGNPGMAERTNNAAATLMTALGACGELSASTFVVIDEETTVAAVWALAPFMNSYSAMGSGTSDEAQMALGFAQARLLVGTSSGTAPGEELPAGYTVPVAEINTIADVLSTCVNSAGGRAGDGSACGLLFSAVKPAGSAAATETIGAALQMAKNTSNNVGGIFHLAPPEAPFEPTLTGAPANWAVGISPTLFEVYVDAQSGRTAINPNIYGIASYGLNAAFAAEIKVPNVRWGGDGTTRYNWQVDSSNAGDDWYFMSGSGTATPVPAASADAMISTYKAAGASSLMTIPIIPYVNNSGAWSCSFPVSVYGAQQATNPYVHPNGGDCGNSIAGPGNPHAADGTQLLDTNIYANHIDNSSALQRGWVQHMVAKFGTAAQGGVPFYQLDNEPGGWGNTHRDVEPNGQPYSQIVTLGEQYAAVVKQVDPTAMVMGPSDFTLGGWIGTPSAQNNLFAGQYYLQQMALYEQQNGARVLDYFDEHYYPQFSDVTSQLAAPRTLWDSTYNGGTWVEQYWFYGPMDLIPRFRQWIGEYYPGTKLAFSEYSIDSGHKLITDALAEADMLGVFGAYQVDFANMWSAPAPTDPIAYAFRLYRNYDGAGGMFGETNVQASVTDPTRLAVYGAERGSDGALTFVVLNKTAAAIGAALSLANFTPGGGAAVYSYTAANLGAIVPGGTVAITANTVAYSFPAYSATMVVIAGAAGAH
jgi:hypothetical protein